MIARKKFIELSLFSFLSACSSSELNSKDSASVNLTISAAASLQDAIQEIGHLYTQKIPNVKVSYNFGASGSLRHQIEQGAPVDIFICAASEYMDRLANKNLLLVNTRHNLLKNEVVLIAPHDNYDLNSFSQLNRNFVSRIAIGDPNSVPAGKYAKEVFSFLNLYQTIEPKLIFAKDVRQVLAYVETGNVEAGIVYKTDVQISDRVKTVATVPVNFHSPIIYPVAIIKDSKYPETAQNFFQFILSNTAKNVFRAYGFSTLS